MRSQSLPTLSLLLSLPVLLVTSTELPAQQTGFYTSESANVPSSSRPADTSEPASSKSNTRTITQSPEDAAKPASTIQLEFAVEALISLLDQNRRSGNRKAEAQTLTALATAYRDLHQYQKAVETFQSGLAIWREFGDNAAQAATLAHVGDCYREWGFPQQSLRFYRDALKMYPATVQREEQAAVVNNLGLAYFGLHDKKKCLENLNDALTYYRAFHDRQGEASTLTNIASAYTFLINDPRKGIDYFQQALTNLELLDNKASEANALELMGISWLKLDKQDTAVQTFQRALFLYSRIGDAQGKASVLKYLKSAGGETVATAAAH